MEQAKKLARLIFDVLLTDETDDDYQEIFDRLVDFIMEDEIFDEEDRPEVIEMVNAQIDPQRCVINCILKEMQKLFDEDLKYLI